MSAPAIPFTEIFGRNLAASAAPVATDLARAIVLERYGIDVADIQQLAAEKDANFRVTAPSGASMLLRVAHPDEDPSTFSLHSDVLLHLAQRAPELPVQRVFRDLEGATHSVWSDPAGQPRQLRLVSFLPGPPQRTMSRSASQRRAIGEILGKLQLALADFSHPAERHRTIWDIQHAGSLRPVLAIFDDVSTRTILEHALDIFDDRVAPALPSLRRQMVHNDFNSDNILISPSNTDEVCGIIDFGDAVNTAAAIDLAVACVYQLHDDDDVLRPAFDVLSGFVSVKQLTEVEMSTLYDLFLVRLAVRVFIAFFRAKRSPENRAYILRNTSQAIAQLHRLLTLPPGAVRERIFNTCKESRIS